MLPSFSLDEAVFIPSSQPHTVTWSCEVVGPFSHIITAIIFIGFQKLSLILMANSPHFVPCMLIFFHASATLRLCTISLTEVAFGCFVLADLGLRCWSVSLCRHHLIYFSEAALSCRCHISDFVVLRDLGYYVCWYKSATKADVQECFFTVLSSLVMEIPNNRYGSTHCRLCDNGWQRWLSKFHVCHGFQT